MKRSRNLLILLIFCYFSCEEKPELNELATKNESGETQIVVTTPAHSKNKVTFNPQTKQYKESIDTHLLQDIAHLGYIAGKKDVHEVIVLGDETSKATVVNTLPIGIIRLVNKELYEDWFVFATITSEICNLEDFILNHNELKNQLQNKFISGQLNTYTSVSWLDETYLELKISEML